MRKKVIIQVLIKVKIEGRVWKKKLKKLKIIVLSMIKIKLIKVILKIFLLF